MPSQSNQGLTLPAEDNATGRLQAFREYIDLILKTGRYRSPTAIAGAAELSASTVNRPYKAAVEGKPLESTLKMDTLVAIQRATGIPFPEKLQIVYGVGAILPGELQDSVPPSDVHTISDERLKATKKGPEDVPVRGIVQGGQDGAFDLNMGGDPLEYVRRPVTLVGRGDLYAVHIDGNSMFPAYRPGETVLVWAAKPPLIGRDVVIQIRPKVDGDNPRAYLKTLVKRSSTEVVLAQYNPPRKFTFKTKDILSIHMVLTRDEMI